jgi:8-oxo-dGTP pyrophosphatase MutT (NUDIX family)
MSSRDPRASDHISHDVPSPHSPTRLARILDAVRAYDARAAARDEPFFEAAVALILREPREGAIELLLIERATRAGDPWSGQIALPGGRRDATDGSLELTAVRETAEEVGINLHRDGMVVGTLDDLRPRTPVLPPVIVRPFVATVPAGIEACSSAEVAAAFWTPLDAVLAPGATIEREIVVRGLRTRRPAIEYEGRVIWGMTERILANFRSLMP